MCSGTKDKVQATIGVDGMSCIGCARTLENEFRKFDGIDYNVSFDDKNIAVSYSGKLKLQDRYYSSVVRNQAQKARYSRLCESTPTYAPGTMCPSTHGWDAPVAFITFDAVPHTVSFARIAKATASFASDGIPRSSTSVTGIGENSSTSRERNVGLYAPPPER